MFGRESIHPNGEYVDFNIEVKVTVHVITSWRTFKLSYGSFDLP